MRTLPPNRPEFLDGGEDDADINRGVYSSLFPPPSSVLSHIDLGRKVEKTMVLLSSTGSAVMWIGVMLMALMATFVDARRNVTVDDTSSMILYTGNWTKSSFAQSPLNYGGSHMVTQDKSAKATFIFTGVGVYFMAPLWPHPASTLVLLDNEPAVLVNLTDPLQRQDTDDESVQSRAVWGRSGLSNVQHTLVISIGEGQSSAVVDALIYTTLEDSEPSSSDTNPSSKRRTVAIAVGCVCASVGVALILVFFLFWRRRQRTRKAARVASWVSGGRPYRASHAPSDSKASSTTKLEPMGSSLPPTMPQQPEMPYSNDPNNPYAMTNLYQSLDPQQIAFLQAQYAQWAMHQYPHAHPRYTINTLSTITEASQSPFQTPASMFGGNASLGAHSPASLQAEFGHQIGGGGGGGGGEKSPHRQPPSYDLQR